MSSIIYDPPPTCRNFMNSTAFGRLIAGPVGSGKTTGVSSSCSAARASRRQAKDGLRYTRFACCARR
jgi:hypothetical protein